MIKQRLITFLWIILFLASCTPGSVTSAPALTLEDYTPTAPSVTPTPTEKPNPVTTVTGRANLTDYPDESPCGSQNLIPQGTQVTLIGTYKDYASIEVQQDGIIKKGFLPKNSLGNIPDDVIELNLNQVPWKPVVDYSAWSYYSSDNGGELIVSPSSDREWDVVSDPISHPVPTSLRIHFGLQESSDLWAEVKIVGLPDNHDPWWKDTTRMDVFVNGDSYELCIRDGTTENCTADIVLDLPQDQEITLLFLDNHGEL